MRHNEVRFRSRRDRENEVLLEKNYRQLGHSAVSAAARYCGLKPRVEHQPQIEAQPQFLMAAE